MPIGENIKQLRANKGLTQEGFARETGISRSYLSDLENNRKSPTIETLEKIARKMNTSLKFLIGGSETMRGVYDLDQQQWYPDDISVDFNIIETRYATVSANSREEAEEIYRENPDDYQDFESKIEVYK